MKQQMQDIFKQLPRETVQEVFKKLTANSYYSVIQTKEGIYLSNMVGQTFLVTCKEVNSNLGNPT